MRLWFRKGKSIAETLPFDAGAKQWDKNEDITNLCDISEHGKSEVHVFFL